MDSNIEVYKYLSQKNLVLFGYKSYDITISLMLKISEMIGKDKYNFILTNESGDYYFGLLEFNKNEKTIEKTVKHYHKRRKILFKLDEVKFPQQIASHKGFQSLNKDNNSLLGAIYIDTKINFANIMYNTNIDMSLGFLESLFI